MYNAPYGELSRSQREERMRPAREVADYLSGGTCDEVARSLGPGFDVIDKAGKLRGRSGKANTKYLRAKEFRVIIGQILSPEKASKDELKMGVGIGADLYNTVA